MSARYIILLVSVAAAAGCATNPAQRQQAVSNAAPLSPEAAVTLNALADASLPSSSCGMILWTLDQNRPAPIFRYVAGKSAEIVIGGKPLELARTEGTGAAGFGVFERQTFAGPDGLTVKVESRFSLGFDGGSYLERGLVSVESPDGWRAVSPAAGIAGCRN
ncbi:MAG: hypothetical protein VX640_09670 [Pseudomonadota bacterium]|nr:hypothetical protein [Pseudomonadota bacterium]